MTGTDGRTDGGAKGTRDGGVTVRESTPLTVRGVGGRGGSGCLIWSVDQLVGVYRWEHTGRPGGLVGIHAKLLSFRSWVRAPAN